MYFLNEIKSRGNHIPTSKNLGKFNLNVESKYFGQKVELTFTNQKKDKNIDDWNLILKQINEFVELNEDKIGWIKNKLWENYLYAIEATDYGFEDIPISQMNIDLKVEEIVILNHMHTANLETIRFNMHHFKIYQQNQIFAGSKINFVEFRKELIIFNFSTIWDDEHDISIYTNNYIFENVE